MCRVFGLNLEKCEFCPCGGTFYLLNVGEGRKWQKIFFFLPPEQMKARAKSF